MGAQRPRNQPDLAFVGNMGGHPGDELEVVHPLDFFALFPISVAEFPLLFIEREALQGKGRPNHVLSHLLGLFPGFGFDLAVD